MSPSRTRVVRWIQTPVIISMCMVLSEDDRRKIDETPDVRFYDRPRFVTHADDGFLGCLTDLYRNEMNPGDRVLDAMSSHVSHLPEYDFESVVGHGMNERELSANERLDEYFLRDFNSEGTLPIDDDSFDVACCALSVQYLQYPGTVFGEFGRVLSPCGKVIVSFTNRMFPSKAVRRWRESSMSERLELVKRYLEESGVGQSRSITERPESDPFCAVVGEKR